MALLTFERLDHALPVIQRPGILGSVVHPSYVAFPKSQNGSSLKDTTGIHPVAVAIPIAAFAWFVIAAWIGFAGDREAAVSIVMVGFVNAMLFGLLAGGGWYSRNMTPEQATNRTFAAFVRGRVDIATGQITGREALLQIAALPIFLAIGGTIIITIAVWCGVGG